MPTENPEKTEKLKNLLSIFEGKIPVYLYYEDTKKYDDKGNLLIRETALTFMIDGETTTLEKDELTKSGNDYIIKLTNVTYIYISNN